MRRHDNQHNDTQRYNKLNATLCTMTFSIIVKCHYAECHYAVMTGRCFENDKRYTKSPPAPPACLTRRNGTTTLSIMTLSIVVTKT
jgi:hypothetical protein